jgi:hypothetical protein
VPRGSGGQLPRASTSHSRAAAVPRSASADLDSAPAAGPAVLFAAQASPRRALLDATPATMPRARGTSQHAEGADRRLRTATAGLLGEVRRARPALPAGCERPRPPPRGCDPGSPRRDARLD